MKSKLKIGIIGLGYVGLPLAIALSKKFDVIGYDKKKNRIDKILSGIDTNLEITKKELFSKKIFFTYNLIDIEQCNVFIICVPTPISNFKPDLKMLKDATLKIGKLLKQNDLVIYESTVYPGLTREICKPILEKSSKLKMNKNFFIGYSPERIDPGNNKKKIIDIKKVVSGSNQKALKLMKKIYGKVIKAGIHIADTIEIAEAAKIIENTQRDINIALMNEFSLLLNKMQIPTNKVLKAAATKWNFLNFSPGLVGGHCIGVDPYYLAFKAKKEKINTKIILAGRKINNFMPKYILQNIKKKFDSIKNFKDLRILCLGATFKEDCPDFRNSLPLKTINLLSKKVKYLFVYDPYYLKNYKKKNIEYSNKIKKSSYDLILILVPHKKIKKLSLKKIKNFSKKKPLIFDIKSIFDSDKVDFQL